MRLILIPCILPLIFLASCSEGPKNEDTMVDESMFINKKDLQARKYYVDSVKSFISWVGANNEIRHYGIIHIENGYFLVKDSAIVGGKLSFKMSSIEILDLKDNPAESSRLSSSLTAKDIFDIGNYPFAAFEINSVTTIVSTKNTRPKHPVDLMVIVPNYIIYGKLTVKGNSRTISFPAKIDMRYYRLQSSANFNLDRSLLGIKSIQPDTLSTGTTYNLPDSVEIELDILATVK